MQVGVGNAAHRLSHLEAEGQQRGRRTPQLRRDGDALAGSKRTVGRELPPSLSESDSRCPRWWPVREPVTVTRTIWLTGTPRKQEALQIYASLPRAQLETPWALAQMGRAHYEQAAYAEAEKYYKRIRQVAPTRFEDMEIYSTILWHLKRETDLAFLAHELIDSSWKSPQAWCALGNSWSLARDHEQALRCFKRATSWIRSLRTPSPYKVTNMLRTRNTTRLSHLIVMALLLINGITMHGMVLVESLRNWAITTRPQNISKLPP